MGQRRDEEVKKEAAFLAEVGWHELLNTFFAASISVCSLPLHLSSHLASDPRLPPSPFSCLVVFSPLLCASAERGPGARRLSLAFFSAPHERALYERLPAAAC